MISLELCTYLTLSLYLAASILGLYGMAFRSRKARGAACLFACLTFLSQTSLLLGGFHKLFPGGLSVGAYLQLFSWFIQLSGLTAWVISRQQSLVLFATQLAAVIFVFSAPWLRSVAPLPGLIEVSFYVLHIGALLLFCGILTTGFLTGMLFVILSNRIKSKKKMTGIWEDLPALGALDKINAYCTLLLFPLFTTGLIFGFSRDIKLGGHLLDGDPKKIISICVWILLAVLFHNRIAKGWKGRKPAILLTAIFFICFFSVFVVNPYFSSMHNFISF